MSGRGAGPQQQKILPQQIPREFSDKHIDAKKQDLESRLDKLQSLLI
jgi:hypothetical protein